MSLAPLEAMLPTGTCFDDAIELLEFFLSQDKARRDTLVLVHALCLQPDGPRQDEPFAHAWLEEGEKVWSAAIFKGQKVQFSADRAAFRQELRVQEETRYSAHQAWLENERSGHFGPWVERYMDFCTVSRRTG